jgi:hypothetical protein
VAPRTDPEANKVRAFKRDLVKVERRGFIIVSKKGFNEKKKREQRWMGSRKFYIKKRVLP